MTVYINGPGHMTKMAAMVIKAKTLKNLLLQNQKVYEFETWHEGQKLYKVYINHDTGMTLTYFTARSKEVHGGNGQMDNFMILKTFRL